MLGNPSTSTQPPRDFKRGFALSAPMAHSRRPFFDSFLACFSLRFSLSDLPTFLALCWCGDFSAMVTPLAGDVIVGGVETPIRERPIKSFDSSRQHSDVGSHHRP